MKTLIYIAIGGALGSVLRYLSTSFINKHCTNIFPYATLIVNILGCFLIGLLLGYLDKNSPYNPNLKYFLITGFCGGFTTFSTFSQENLNLIQNQQAQTAIIYTLTSTTVGIAAVYFGLLAAKT